MNDVPVWDAPRIGRKDGMLIEEKCYATVVLWGDHASVVEHMQRKHESEIERLRQLWDNEHAEACRLRTAIGKAVDLFGKTLDYCMDPELTLKIEKWRKKHCAVTVAEVRNGE